MDYFKKIMPSDSVDEANMGEDGVNVNFGYFLTDKAQKIDSGTTPGADRKKKSSGEKTSKITGKEIMENAANASSSTPIVNVETVDYAQSYNETNNLIRATIAQADELSMAIKKDTDDIRSSKTLKGKYTYLTNLTSSASSLLTTKISAIRELNSTITQCHNLELNRMKALKLDAKNEANDDMKIMDMYSAFVNTPIGSYTPVMPSIQDLTIGVNGDNGVVAPVEMMGDSMNGPLTPEQNRMRMESNPNIQVVVKYDQSSGQRFFDVIDKQTGASIPNYPRPDAFLLEDTTIDVHARIARNRNINTVWPLVIEGSNMFITEY